MNQFKEIFQGLRDSFMQMPMPTRVIGSGMVVIIAIGLWLLVSGTGRATSMERLFTSDSLSDDEITKVLSAFSSARLNGWKVDYNRIYVPATSRDEYYRAVEAAGALPLQEGSILEKIQEQASPFSSNSSRIAREDHGKELDLGKKIATYPNVLRASVEHDRLSQGFQSNVKQTASVVVVPKGSAPLAPELIAEIRKMVCGSYAGMSIDDVTVTDINAGGSGGLDEDNPLFSARKKWEKWFTSKAQNILADFGPLSIDATVDIDPKMGHENAKLAYDQAPTALQENSAQTTTESTRPAPNGVPGAATNGPGMKAVAIDPVAQVSKTTQKSESTMKVTGENFEQSRTADFQPTRVSYSVGVPESYYEQIWRSEQLRKDPSLDPTTLGTMTVDERANLKKTTADQIKLALSPTLLPAAPGEDKFPMIEVWDYRDLAQPAAPEASQIAAAMSWLASSWQTLGLFALALVALLVARGVAKMGTGGVRPEFAEGFGLEIPQTPMPRPIVEEGESGPKLTITGQNLKTELSQMVSNNPEAAANVIRKWIDSPVAA